MPFSQVREALTALGASPFVQKVIDPSLVELQRRYMPLVRAIPTQRWTTDIYNFNQRTAVPAGGFVPDGGAKSVANSTYVQDSYQMKHIQCVYSVTGYAQEVANLVDLMRTEAAGATMGYYWDMECGICWGNSASTAGQAQPQYDGLDTLVSDFGQTNSGYPNSVDFTNTSMTLGMLDQIADQVQKNAKEPVFNSNWMWIMSTTAHSRLAQLCETNQRFVNAVEIDAGLIVDTYRRIPVLDTSFLSSYGYSMGSVSTSTATTGGTIPLSTTYYYQVAPVISRAGETTPSTAVSQESGSGGNTNTITLSFTDPTGVDGSVPQLYKVYRGTSSSTTFLGYVDATVGLMSDGVTPIYTTSIIDTGTALVPQNGATVPAVLPTTYYGKNASLLPPAAGSENIYLISRNRKNVVRPYVREAKNLQVYPTTQAPDNLPAAIMGDTTFAVRASRFVGRGARVAVALTN